MKIDVINPVSSVSVPRFEACVTQVFAGEQQSASFVNIVFLTNDALRLMKKEYFGLDVYTDVIAFNLNDPDDLIEGEIYLSYDQIQANAKLFNTKPEDELYRVLIHGCLHLCGYEDDTQILKDKMTVLENHYMNKPYESDQ